MFVLLFVSSAVIGLLAAVSMDSSRFNIFFSCGIQCEILTALSVRRRVTLAPFVIPQLDKNTVDPF